MDLEEEVRRLRARLDAADMLIEQLLAWLFVDGTNEFKKQMILAGLKMASTTVPNTGILADDLAMEHADNLVMMHEALKKRIDRLAPFLEPYPNPSGQVDLEEGKR